jgi:DNA-binding transcriptional regulator YiaG
MLPNNRAWTKENTPQRVENILLAIRRNQTELAALLGVSIQTVNRWYNGHAAPRSIAARMLTRLETIYVLRRTDNEQTEGDC